MTVDAGQANKLQAAAPREPGVPWFLIVLIGLLAVITPALALLTDGNPAVVAAPVFGIAFVYMLWKIPLRFPVLALVFLGLTLECPGDSFASDRWVSPTHMIGQFFFLHWNLLIPVPPLIVSGVDIILILLFPIAIYRRATRSRIDGEGFVEAASPLRYFCAVTIFGALFIWMWGAARGGLIFKYSLWQVQHAIYVPIFFFLLQYAVRPQDIVTFGKTLLAAAVFRALLSIGIRTFVTPNDYEQMPVASGHHDSLLFAGALCLCVALVVEMPTKKNLKIAAMILPILAWGMVANNRRLVWVEAAEALLVFYFVLPMSRTKRKLVRYLLMALPAFAVYLAVGWDSNGKFFGAAHTVRSLIDSKTDRSTLWRDFENFDLIATMKSSPLVGVGYGHPYLDVIELDKVPYELEHYLPHNSVLGLWAYGGIVGFTLLWTMFAVASYFAARCYRRATRPIDRVASISCLMMIFIYMAHCYGDLGYGAWPAVFIMSVVLAVIGKLAITTGAWPSRVVPESALEGGRY